MNTSKQSTVRFAAALALTGILAAAPALWGQTKRASLNGGAIERLTGAKGQLDEKEGVFKVSVPRKDLSVVIAGVKITPPMGLTSWAAFQRAGEHDMVMGDLVLTPQQISPVMDSALRSGLQVTALHNHFVMDSPRIMFMHIGGLGSEQDLARAVGRVFATIKETSGNTGQPDAQIDPSHSSLDAAKLDSELGVKGQYKTVCTNSSSGAQLECKVSRSETRWA